MKKEIKKELKHLAWWLTGRSVLLGMFLVLSWGLCRRQAILPHEPIIADIVCIAFELLALETMIEIVWRDDKTPTKDDLFSSKWWPPSWYKAYRSNQAKLLRRPKQSRISGRQPKTRPSYEIRVVDLEQDGKMHRQHTTQDSMLADHYQRQYQLALAEEHRLLSECYKPTDPDEVELLEIYYANCASKYPRW